jgi:hypothetical protein
VAGEVGGVEVEDEMPAERCHALDDAPELVERRRTTEVGD